MTKSDDNNAMECRVGLAVAASVEPMPVGLAGGSKDGIDTAQGGEGSLGVEAVRVTPGSNEEGRRRVWSYAEAIHQGWVRALTAESLVLLNIRIISTSPSPDLRVASATPASTARAAISASVGSLFPFR